MVSGKKVVREVSGWLRVFEDGSVDRTWAGPPEFKFLTQPVPAHNHFIDGVATHDITVDPNSGLSVRIYRPNTAKAEKDRSANRSEKLPIILHLHGGGFCVTRADWFMYYHIYTRLARSTPAICVSVNLRLAPEHRLPAACDDAFATLLWLRSVAQGRADEPCLTGSADFGRVFLMGDSSGANLVHETAARAGQAPELRPVRVAGGVLIHPGFVRPERSESEAAEAETPMLTLEMVDGFLGLALPEGSTKEHPLTCPMGAAAPPLGELRLPPLLLAVAEKDLMKDTEMEYYEAMKEAGKEVELLENAGVGHSFYLNKVAVDTDPRTAAETDRLVAEIGKFISKH